MAAAAPIKAIHDEAVRVESFETQITHFADGR